jgi:hypothetical protein
MYYLTFIVGREESIVDVESRDTAPTPSLAYHTRVLCLDFNGRRAPSTRVCSAATAAAASPPLSALLLPTFFTLLFSRRSPVHRCPQGLGAEGEPARLLDHGLVQWWRWAVDVDYVLFTILVMEVKFIAQGRSKGDEPFRGRSLRLRPYACPE